MIGHLVKVIIFKSFTRYRSVMKPVDKDAAIYPVPFKRQMTMLRRPIGIATDSVSADIRLSYSPELRLWKDNRRLIRALWAILRCTKNRSVSCAYGNIIRLAGPISRDQI